jgi:hypothetical protein
VLLFVSPMDSLERLAKAAAEKSSTNPFDGLHEALDAVGVPRTRAEQPECTPAPSTQPTYRSAPWHASDEVERSKPSLEAARAWQQRDEELEVDVPEVSEVERLRSEIASLEATQAEQHAIRDEIKSLEALHKRHKGEMHAAHAKNLAQLTAELTELGPLPPSGEPSSASQGVEPVAQSWEEALPTAAAPSSASHEEALPTASQGDSAWSSGWYEQRYWRGSGQRYGARGSTTNPNVMWHSARAAAMKRGVEYYTTWLSENPKPPNRAERDRAA